MPPGSPRCDPAPLLFLALALAQTLCQSQSSAPVRVAEVRRVVGGNAVVRIPGKNVTFRLVGVDIPEMVDLRKRFERFGKGASAFLRKTLDGRRARVELIRSMKRSIATAGRSPTSAASRTAWTSTGRSSPRGTATPETSSRSRGSRSSVPPSARPNCIAGCSGATPRSPTRLAPRRRSTSRRPGRNTTPPVAATWRSRRGQRRWPRRRGR